MHISKGSRAIEINDIWHLERYVNAVSCPNLQNFFCKTVTQLLTRRTILLETSTYGIQTKMASLTFER